MENKLVFEEIREIQNQILKKFDQYCTVKGYQYCLWAGTLLGAIRHKGHIPWDDDVDIAMPRSDYERLLSDFKNNPIGGVRLVSFKNCKNYYYPFAKLSDNCSQMKEKNIKQQDYGVFVDVFPLDTIQQTTSAGKIAIKKCRFAFYLLHLSLQEKCEWNGGRSIIDNVFLKPISKLISRKKYSVYIENIIKKESLKSSEFIAVLTHSSLAKKYVNIQDVFPTVKIPFECLQLCVPRNYETILTTLYGDYMTPPPVKDQVAKHNMDVWRIENK